MNIKIGTSGMLIRGLQEHLREQENSTFKSQVYISKRKVKIKDLGKFAKFYFNIRMIIELNQGMST